MAHSDLREFIKALEQNRELKRITIPVDPELEITEFADRAGMVWAAATSMELDAIVADLPAPRATTPAPQHTPMVGDASRRKIRRRVIAIMSGASTKGRWRVGDSVTSIAVMGGVEIDLREAEFDVMYGEGISREGDLLDLAVEKRIVEKSGAWFAYSGERLGQGRENAKQFLKDNVDVRRAIDERVRKELGLTREADVVAIA